MIEAAHGKKRTSLGSHQAVGFGVSFEGSMALLPHGMSLPQEQEHGLATPRRCPAQELEHGLAIPRRCPRSRSMALLLVS